MVDLTIGIVVGTTLVSGLGLGFLFGWLYLKGRLQQWQNDKESEIRDDAIKRSGHVTLGKVAEHFAPYFNEFLGKFNPRDARFLGSPIDLVVFDGLDEGNLRRIVFVEVKTGKSSLSPRERQVKEIVESKLVEWQKLEKFSN